MNIEKLSIKNFRCFNDEFLIEFAQSDGSPGSGLTILIGENACGKTTILEAISLLTQNRYTTENTLKVHDFNNFKEPIIVNAQVSDLKCFSNIAFYKDWFFDVAGVSFTAKNRTIKQRNKLLSSLFEIKNSFIPKSNYTKPDGKVDKEVDGRDLVFNNEQIEDDELNIFYFDKNRTRQMTHGNYKTTLEKIFDDLNWKFLKNLDTEKENKIIKNLSGEFFNQIDQIVGGSAGSKLSEELSNFFEADEYKNLRTDLLDILHPFNNAEIVVRPEKSLIQKRLSQLGSGVEMIATVLLLRMISNASGGTIIYLIDEPELHLHPKAQSKLLDLLIDESKNKQVIFSTHSPYMFKGVFSTSARLVVCSREKADETIKVSDTKKVGWGLFGKNSPTWGEINYFAYDLPTVEFHNELYGHIQALAINQDENNYIESTFDQFLQTKLGSGKVVVDWIKELQEKDNSDNQITETNSRALQTFIRNSIHHPENKHNRPYTPKELFDSTAQLITVLRNMI